MCARKKHIAKHTAKKSPAVGSDLFPAANGTRSPSEWSTAAQLFPHTGLDDAALRRRARETNPATGAPWIPSPRGSKWPLTSTALGLLAWYRHQLAAAGERALPRRCANMRDLEALYFIPREMQQYLRDHGLCPDAFEDSNRVNILPLLKAAQPFLKKIFSGSGAELAGLEGFEELDKDTMQARVYAQDEIKKIRDNALANSQLHTREGIEKQIAEPLAAIAAKWKNYEKETGTKLKSLLAGAGVAPELIRQTIHVATAGVQEPMEKLRAALKTEN